MIPIDASSMSHLVCGRRYYISCVLGIRIPSVEMLVGKAIHKVLEKLAKREEIELEELAKMVPQSQLVPFISTAEYLKNRGDLLGTPALDANGHPCSEWFFSFIIGKIEDEEICLCGTIDYIEKGPMLIVRDYKTSRKARISEVLSKYGMTLQLYLYMWALKNYLKSFLGEAEQKLIEANRMHGQIRGIFLSFTPIKIEDSSPISLKDSLNIPNILEPLVKKAYLLHKSKDLPPPEGMAYGVCDNCPFYPVCVSQDDRRVKDWIEQQPKTIYDPSRF